MQLSLFAILATLATAATIPKRSSSSIFARLAKRADTDGLAPGQVFSLMAIRSGSEVHQQTIKVYGDATLGTTDPFNPEAKDFKGVLFPEYGVIFQPEPLQCLKVNENGVTLVNDSLFNPITGFQAHDGYMELPAGEGMVICPTMNHVLLPRNDSVAPCPEAIDIALKIITN